MRLFLLCIIFSPLFFVMSHGAQIPDSNLLLGKPGEDTTIETRDGGTITRDQAASTWTVSEKLISPILEANSTSEASNPCPPMTQSQIDSATASDGGCVYNTDRKQLNIYDAGTSSFKAVKGGGGAGDGINGFSDDQNPNAESGTEAWTASAGTFGIDDTDPIEGDQSFTWTPAAQGDTLTSSVLDFDRDAFKGRACEARIEAIGGDENLSVQVIDGNDDVVGEKQFSAQTITAPFSVYFRCPSQARITADAEKGNLRLRIINDGASASPQIKWDLSYAGTLKGLIETVLPDVLSVNVQNNGSITIGSSKGGEWWDSIVRDSEGLVTINYSGLGLTAVPGYSVTQSTDIVRVISISSSEITVRTKSDISTLADTNFSLTIIKHNADAKQSAQVFYNIPKVSENVNGLEAFYDKTEATLTDAVKEQTPNQWITNTAKSGTSNETKTFTVPIGVFSKVPKCVASGTVNTVPAFNRASSTTTSLVFITRVADDNVSLDTDFDFTCFKHPDDYKLPTVQPVVLRENAAFFEGETDSFITGYASFGGATDKSVCDSSPCTRYRAVGIGENMSATRVGQGDYDVSVTGFKINSFIRCECYSSESASARNADCRLRAESLNTDASGSVTFNIGTADVARVDPIVRDTYFQVSCTGPKPL